MHPSWFGSWRVPPVVIVIQCACWMLRMGTLPHNVLYPGSDSMWLLQKISQYFLVLSCFSLYHHFGKMQLFLVARVLGVVALFSFKDTVRCMRQLWFLGSFLCPEGCYSSSRSRSLSIDLSKRTWWDTLLGTSYFHLHCLHLHMIY